MNPMFVGSAVISGAISFVAVRALRKNEQKKFDAKMQRVDTWLNRSK